MHSIFHTSGIKRIAAICVFGIIFLMIILTGSRGGIFQVIITLLWYLNLIRSRSRFSSVVGITLVLCGLLLLGIQILPPQVSGRLGIMSILQDQGTGRFTVWRMGLEALKDRPLFGYGWYNFPIAYDQYSAIFWPKNYRGRFLGWHRSAHNLYLQTLVELGIVGFGMLMCAIWSHFREIQGLVAKKDPLAPQISAILIAMLASGLTLEVATSKSFWATFGLVQIAVNISRTTRSNDAS
jgi:O-antigen ligase